MEQQDLELERRVWQRISGGEQECGGVPSLREMEQRCRESAAAFRQLAQLCTGAMRDGLQELFRQEYGNALTLMGMRVLSGEEPEKMPCCPWTKTGVCRALALAYRTRPGPGRGNTNRFSLPWSGLRRRKWASSWPSSACAKGDNQEPFDTDRMRLHLCFPNGRMHLSLRKGWDYK